MLITLFAAAASGSAAKHLPHPIRQTHAVARLADADPEAKLADPVLREAIAQARFAEDHRYDGKKDMFASAPPPSTDVGKSFHMTMALEPWDKSGGPALYSYIDGVLTLWFTTERLGLRSSDPHNYNRMELPGVDLARSSDVYDRYHAQNGFGAQTVVTKYAIKRAGIAFTSYPELMVNPSDKYVNQFTPKTDWWVRMTLPPGQAKAIALDSQAVLEGQLTELEVGKGNAGGCIVDVSPDPTVSDPTQSVTTSCYASIALKRVAIVRRSSGELIKEWIAQ